MDLVLYDTEHFETLHTWIRLLAAPGHRLHLLVPAAMKKKLEAMDVSPAGIEWHLLPDAGKTHPGSVGRLVRKLQAPLLILGTVSFRHYAFARVCKQLKGCKTVLGMHDIEDSFRPLRGSGFKNLLRFWSKKQLVKAVSAYSVLLPGQKEYIRQKRYTDKPVYVVPGRVFDKETYRLPPEGPLRLVVPGSLDPARRDYEQVRRLLERLRVNGETDIRVVIAGSASYKQYDPAWLHSFEDLLEVRTGSFVAASDYALALAEASIVWAPLPESYQSAGKPNERYGESKSSGSFFDAVSAGRPLLLPAHIAVPEALRSCTLTYKDEEELYYLMRALSENAGARASLQVLALNAANEFTTEKLRGRLGDQLLAGR